MTVIGWLGGVVARRTGRLVAAAILLGAAEVVAQWSTPEDSTTVVPGSKYRAGGFKRTFLGSDYRDLWTVPIKVPVLDLDRFAGGLTPTEEGGGEQTRSLRFKGQDGREYQFRSVDKDGAGALPEGLRRGVVASLVRDQTSSSFPAASIMIPVLLEAAGILHAPPKLYRMPDDGRLGEFREKFAGMLGTIEERPDSGFAGATEVLDTEELFARLNRDGATRVDSREYLAARLIDLVIGDWDRHRDQWRWALIGDTWRPIPRDRDAALSGYDGFLVGLARMVQPRLQRFEADYPNVGGLTRNGAEVDRRLLGGLERETWDSVAAWLRGRLTDSVLAAAVSRLPREFAELRGEWLREALRVRRDHLERIAERFYERLADTVELTATDESETVRIEREGRAALITATQGERILFRRRFHSDQTQEVRVFLRGGNDRVTLVAEPGSPGTPLVRIIGGDGEDHYEISGPRSGFRLYDASGTDRIAGRIGIDRKPWPWEVDSIWPTRRPRDQGMGQSILPTLGIASDVGLVAGVGGYIDWYSFRTVPYQSRLSFRAEYSSVRKSGRVRATVTRQLENSPLFLRLFGSFSGIESLRWYGFGNETAATEPSDFYRVRMNELRAAGSVGLRLGGRASLEAGPVLRRASTGLDTDYNAARFIADDRPYGSGGFTLAGAGARLDLDFRDSPSFARSGAALRVEAEAYPRWLDADSAVARVEAQGSVAFAPVSIGGRRPSLHLMAGGVKTWGKLPYFLAPTLGGRQRLRGYHSDRFAGDAALFGSAELRVPLTRALILVPGEQGLFGFVDAGKVMLRNEPSDRWHWSAGGGVWFSFYQPQYVVFLAAARPDQAAEGVRFLFGFGFPY